MSDGFNLEMFPMFPFDIWSLIKETTLRLRPRKYNHQGDGIKEVKCGVGGSGVGGGGGGGGDGKNDNEDGDGDDGEDEGDDEDDDRRRRWW